MSEYVCKHGQPEGAPCDECAAKQEGVSELAASAGSASEKSADEWAAAGRKAANMAMAASERGHEGTAIYHRTTAKLCFECEHSLRVMQNADISGGGDGGKS